MSVYKACLHRTTPVSLLPFPTVYVMYRIFHFCLRFLSRTLYCAALNLKQPTRHLNLNHTQPRPHKHHHHRCHRHHRSSCLLWTPSPQIPHRLDDQHDAACLSSDISLSRLRLAQSAGRLHPPRATHHQTLHFCAGMKMRLMMLTMMSSPPIRFDVRAGQQAP